MPSIEDRIVFDGNIWVIKQLDFKLKTACIQRRFRGCMQKKWVKFRKIGL